MRELKKREFNKENTLDDFFLEKINPLMVEKDG